MIIIETCPKCGHDLDDTVITTYPPINKKECPACGWSHEETAEIKRVSWDSKDDVATDYIRYSDELKRMLLRDNITQLKVYGDDNTCIEYQRVKHGIWIVEEDRYFHWHCSKCGYVISGGMIEFNYCPKCGAYMRDDKSKKGRGFRLKVKPKKHKHDDISLLSIAQTAEGA